MHISKYLIPVLCASVFILTGQAMAGDWTDEFEDEDQMAEDWTPLFGTWKFMDGKYRMEAGAVSGASITDFSLSDATSIEINAAYVNGGWENFSCTVTDIDGVDEVKLVLIGDTTTEYLMSKDGDNYYINTTILTADEYTYYIWANDTNRNYNTSTSQQLFIDLFEGW